ncbi:hypothetical protein [Niallia sp. 03133]|uniref:hypothetical protein n=1 Tax=Niallia sp. 03133 TaxID=3458060 RepID=UPI0040440578
MMKGKTDDSAKNIVNYNRSCTIAYVTEVLPIIGMGRAGKQLGPIQPIFMQIFQKLKEKDILL